MEKLDIKFATPEGDAAGKLIMSKPADGNGTARPQRPGGVRPREHVL